MSSEEVAAASARREKIVLELLELLTGPAFSTKELQRLRFVADIFGISPVIKELCSSASTLEGRTELALAGAMAFLNVAIDSTLPVTPERILERREAAKERHEVERELKQRLSAGRPDAGDRLKKK